MTGADDDTLLDYSWSTKPTVPVVDSGVTLVIDVTRRNADDAVHVEYIDIDVHPGDGADSLTTVEGADNGVMTNGGGQAWQHQVGAQPYQGEFPPPVPASVFRVHYDRGRSGKFPKSMQITVAVDTNQVPGQVTCRIAEKSAPGNSPRDTRVRIRTFTVTKHTAGSVFENFGPVPPRDTLIGRGDVLHLGWHAKFPAHPGPRGSAPYATLTIAYEDKRVDVTGKANYSAGETLTLSHVTPFTLTADLYGSDQRLEDSYTLATVVSVAAPDVDAGGLTVAGTARLLAAPRSLDEGIYSTYTDGLLLCTVRGTPDSSLAGLGITVQSPDETHPEQYLITSDTPGDPADHGTKILVPVRQGSVVILAQDPAPGHGLGRDPLYRATWHPLGTSPGLT
ncbi:hypothetical protein [Streptomyces sp. A012304]|uniref:hypothetical protein n=1 Tax=Streptomyces sp. A012304 TaxID=375446 RepID=UPI0022316BB8|nr:hypothetical protein [Streptomyces sp. A012304]GKQ38436.1 hypothetical protein ALMP_49670 [Streptomyces sp. A012304]